MTYAPQLCRDPVTAANVYVSRIEPSLAVARAIARYQERTLVSTSTFDAPVAGVPVELWRAPSFRRWYDAQTAAGNTLESADLQWALSVGEKEEPFLWVLKVAVRVAAENRVKANEVVLSRPDLSAVALYRAAPVLDDTVVVLIREFRSPASTPDGFVHELPGGSGAESDPRDQAAAEVVEETGLSVAADRLVAHGSRQVAATLSAHHAHLYSAAITEAELAWLRSQCDVAHGDGYGQERTWIEITTYGEMRRGRSVDWATLGMLTQALLEAREARDED